MAGLCGLQWQKSEDNEVDMSNATTIFHIQGQAPEAVEGALDAIFAREERPRALRLEGTYTAVLARALDPDLVAGYRYLILRAHPASAWTPLLELGNRTEGLDVALSAALNGCVVFTLFVYGDTISGYRVARNGAEVDRYLSDPTYFASEEDEEEHRLPGIGAFEELRGRPERFAELLPAGTAPAAMAQVVLHPGWWEEHDAALPTSAERLAVVRGIDSTDHMNDMTADTTKAKTSSDDAQDNDDGAQDDDDEDLVDETDRMRCIALALELWGPSEYPFTQELEDIPNTQAGPALALAFT
ncbi:MAG: hypothetical protein ABI068_05380 [Ktedonobacterales bacterium]